MYTGSKDPYTFGVLGGCHPYPYVNQFTSSWGRKCSSMMRDSCDISGSVRIQIFIHFHPADLKICLGESTEYVGVLPYLLSIWSPHPEAANAASWCGIVITSLNLVRFKDLNVFIQQIRRSDWVNTMNIWDSPPFYSYTDHLINELQMQLLDEGSLYCLWIQ